MLPLPRLDNENFEEIFSDAKRQIPGLTSEWTDFNYHDPGITLLQLLAWLKEMQQFYLDGIGEIHRLKYLKLLNHLPRRIQPAWTDITLTGAKRDMVLPGGTKFDAQGVIFETEKPFSLLDNRIECLQSLQDGRYADITYMLEDRNGLSEYIFGERPEDGNEFIIGFQKGLPVNMDLLLYIRLVQKKGIIRNIINGEGVYPLAQLRWKYWTNEGWKDIYRIHDGTYGLIKDGYIEFSIDEEMEPSIQKGCSRELYWIKCVLAGCSYDIAPMAENISIHSVRVIQKDTVSEVLYFDGKGTEQQSFIPDTFLSLAGSVEVQVRREDGLWETWKDFAVEKGDTGWQQKLMLLKDENGRVPPPGAGNIRVICKCGELEEDGVIGSSTGYPEQRYEIGFEGVMEDSFLLQVGVPMGEKMLWQDWGKSDDLMLEGSDSLSYRLDAENGCVIFGDGENGSIPPKGINNIRIVSCSMSNGLKGNIKDGGINSVCMADLLMEQALEGVMVTNKTYAEGGRNPESIEDALLRFRKDIHKTTRAVTVEDYENIVRETPGLIICKVCAIPGYRPDTGYLDTGDTDSCITVVVKAYSDRTFKPGLNEAYLVNIKSHLDRYRLVTTEVHVISPRYIGVNVSCVVEVKPYYKDIKGQLKEFFERELDGVNGKRNFGQNVEYGDIYGKMESLDCVKRIVSLSLDARGAGVSRKYGGDIRIPPDGLTYMETFDLQIKE